MRLLNILPAVVCLFLISACGAAPGPRPVPEPGADPPGRTPAADEADEADPFAGLAVRQSRWAAVLTMAEESTPMTVIVATAENFDRRVRVIVLSTYGTAFGECFLVDRAGGACRAVPGADRLVERVSTAVRGMLLVAPDFLRSADYDGNTAVGSGWEALKDSGGNIVYRRLASPPWTMSLTRMP
ncbi:MAG: hypothetical protein LBS31_06620 [Candidatus Adiutrix sp.]|jgi:hypothetical protein|nr:hypothetical protein [Candidatus Adiutrix sp.]